MLSPTTPSTDQMVSRLKICAKAQSAIAGSFQLLRPSPKYQAVWSKSSSMQTTRLARPASTLFNFTPLASRTQSSSTTGFHYRNSTMEAGPECMLDPQPTKPSLVLSSRKPSPSTTATTSTSLAVTPRQPSEPCTAPPTSNMSIPGLRPMSSGTRLRLLIREAT